MFMFNVLSGMRAIEGASFIAASYCCLHLAQLGAQVIRFDMIGGERIAKQSMAGGPKRREPVLGKA